MIAILFSTLVIGFSPPGSHQAASMPMPSHVQTTRYLGTPNLGLTVALVSAGGGAKNFDSLKLLGVLAGPQTGAEVRRLMHRFGKQRVLDFASTFNVAIADAIASAQKAHVALPQPTPGLSTDGGLLSASLVRAGTMPGGRFDVGYLIEHLVSRPIHVDLMQELNADANVGPDRNANFHIVLTRLVADLRTQYGL